MSLGICTLCEEQSFITFKDTGYLHCPLCGIITKPKHLWLNAEEEKARYATHENSIENAGYVQFLTPVANLVNSFVSPGAKGLDYGCGPGPVLSFLLQKNGMQMTAFDPYFFPVVLNERNAFDFITCTEAAEHFFYPGKEFKRLFTLLKPAGALIVMTETVPTKTSFKDWYYIKDPTHITFFNEKSLQWIADKYSKKLTIVSPRLFSFT